MGGMVINRFDLGEGGQMIGFGVELGSRVGG